MDNVVDAVGGTGLQVLKNKKPILGALDFSIQKGTLTGLVGPSGSGKTTLMRAIVGVQRLTKGELRVLGLQAGDARLRAQIGYVTQTPSVYGDLTVEQNLRYFATIARAGRLVVDQVIETVHLASQRSQIVDTLSGGQRARVSLAVALLGDPELLVLDEPTVGLDPVLREELWALFKDLADDGKTLLISSHVMDEAERCDQLILLRDGKLLWNDSKSALLKETSTTDVGSAFIAAVTGRAR
jgi:ABC-2 type transport system ATP-binding protein